MNAYEHEETWQASDRLSDSEYRLLPDDSVHRFLHISKRPGAGGDRSVGHVAIDADPAYTGKSLRLVSDRYVDQARKNMISEP